MARFEGYERREAKILAALKEYGINSIDECKEICDNYGIDPYKIVEETQPICFENAKWAYTVDGGEVPEIEYENFNGAAVKLTVHGINIHPGEAKNKMKNAALMLCDFVSRMPAAEIPAHTCGYEGFYHLTGIEGDETLATLGMIIRDHDREKFESRKAFVKNLADYMNSVYGDGTFVLDIHDSYYNMKEQILPHMHIIEAAENAMRANGLSPVCVPIRGGTDGARLSYMGLPCPNLPTGGVNFHSIHEFISIQSMETMVNVLIELMRAE